MILNNYFGKFIVFEGPDGSGQSTQAGLLTDYLKNQTKKVILTKEPTRESIAGRKIREEVLPKKVSVTQEEFQKLCVEDRKEHLERIIGPALKRGEWVISDRYFLSTLAYGSLGCDLDWLIKLNQDFILPDLMFILDVRAEICIERIKKRGYPFDFFETREKLTRVRENYLKLAPSFSNTFVLEGEVPIEDVHHKIIELTSKIL